MIRIGQGYDVHQLVPGRNCIIGGITIPYPKGLLGHSDADVLVHAIADGILGALALGDLGSHFSDTDPQYKDVDSISLLHEIWLMATAQGYQLNNLDATIIAQAPKMASYIPAMKERLTSVLTSELARINIKATTTEWLGFIGRGEGIAAQAVVLLETKG